MLFLQRYVERDIRSAHPPQKISKPSPFFNFFINQTFLVNIYAESTANLQNRAGRDFLVVCNLHLEKNKIQHLNMYDGILLL